MRRPLKALEVDTRTKRLFNLRNNFYAHVAIDRKEKDVSVSYKEVVEYVDRVELIYIDLYRLIKGADLTMDLLKDDVGHYLYEALNSHNKLWSLYEQYKISLDRSKITPEEIMKILYEK